MFKDTFSISVKTFVGVVLLLGGNFMIFLGSLLLSVIGGVVLLYGGYLLYKGVKSALSELNDDDPSEKS